MAHAADTQLFSKKTKQKNKLKETNRSGKREVKRRERRKKKIKKQTHTRRKILVRLNINQKQMLT